MSSPSLRSLAAVFVRHGDTTFGGGSATIATLHGQIVTKRKWIIRSRPVNPRKQASVHDDDDGLVTNRVKAT